MNDDSFENFATSLENKKPNRVMLKEDIQNKGYEIQEVAKKTKISVKKINDFINNKKKNHYLLKNLRKFVV